jgi:hypothetical protein
VGLARLRQQVTRHRAVDGRDHPPQWAGETGLVPQQRDDTHPLAIGLDHQPRRDDAPVDPEDRVLSRRIQDGPTEGVSRCVSLGQLHATDPSVHEPDETRQRW